MVEYQKLYVRLHPYSVDKFLLFLDDWIVGIATNLFNPGHLYALLGLFDGLLREVEHLLQRLHVKV